MTAAQKAAQARFKKAVKIAADIRKKNPKLTQAEAVKKAFATIGAPAKKAATAKKAAVKKKAAPAKKAAVKKKAAPTKKAAKKSCATDHRDSKSHNVNIRVVSGVDKLSAGAKKLWIEINKKGLFKYNTEENILKYLYDDAIRKGQYKKAEYLQELIKDIKYY